MTAPQSGQTIALLQFTDPHLFANETGTLRGVNTDHTLRQVIRQARRDHWPPRAILATGDLVQDDSAAAYARFARLLGDLGVPVYCLPGNHDVPALMTAALTEPPFQNLGHVTMDRWCIVMLDSTSPGEASGRLRAGELERLSHILDSHQDHHALVCLHHHPVPSGSTWLDRVALRNSAELFACLAGHDNVRALLWGHVHQHHDSTFAGIRLLGTPSTCAQFLPHSADFAIDTTPPAYRWIKLLEDGEIQTDVCQVQADAGNILS